MLKKHMTPLTKGGDLVAHRGKGHKAAPMPSRVDTSNLAVGPRRSINDFAKATPMPMPSPGAFPSLGDGDWPGDGK